MPLALYALAPLLVLAPALACISPRSMAALYIACGIFALAAHVLQNRALPAFDKRWLYAVAAFAGYGCLTQIWTENPDETFGKAIELGGLFALSILLHGVMRGFDNEARERLFAMVLAGLGIGCGVYLFEYHSNFMLYELARGGVSGDVADVKQNKAIFLLALWFYLSFIPVVPNKTWAYRFFYISLYALMVHLTFISKSASAQIIIVIAPFLAFIMYALPARRVLQLTLAVSIFLTAAMPFGAVWVYRNTDWRTNPNLNDSVRSRIEIWDQAARRTFEKPLLGWGLDSASKLPNRNEVTVITYVPDPKPIAHLHPHNAPIQIWFELGAVGAAMAAALFAFFYRRIRTVESAVAQKFAAFSWAVTFLYTLSIWGIWQSWFTATLCFMAVMTAAAVRRFE